MATDKEKQLEDIIKQAIPLSSCPTTKAGQIASRGWLKKKVIQLFEPRENNITFDPREQIKKHSGD